MLKARFIEEIGTRVCVGYTWAGLDHYHRAERSIADIFTGDPKEMHMGDVPEELCPTHCDICGEPVPEEASPFLVQRRLYNTDSGKPEPGDLFWSEFHTHPWDNDTELHLIAVLPNGQRWDIDSRASNCTMPQEKTHRCWCRHGEPPNITVDKNGYTCQAGAGSIVAGDYHGFLRDGQFIKC